MNKSIAQMIWFWKNLMRNVGGQIEISDFGILAKFQGDVRL